MNFYKMLSAILCISYLLVLPTLFAEINRDLELDALFTCINYTHTAHGGKALQRLLAHPTDNLEILRNRQSAITYIIENQHLYTKLSSLLQTLRIHEPHFERMLCKASDIETAALEEFYFSHPYFKKWNHCPVYLELGQLAYFGNLCSSLLQHSLTYAVFTLGFDEKHVCAAHPLEDHDNHHHDHHHHDNHHHDDHHHEHSHDDNCMHPSHHNNQILHNLKFFAKSQKVRSAFHAWHIIAQLQELYSIQAIIRNHCNCITEIQTQLIGIAHGMHVLKNIHKELRNHPEITAHLECYQILENVCLSTNISSQLQTLLALLTTNTFKGKASPFSRIGIILAAYKLLQDIGHELHPALNAIGEIDAYVSCAQLFKEHQHNQLTYSFAQYETDSTRPQLNAFHFWHPLATTDCIKFNTLSLGSNDKPQHIIITGPNACGKSTSLKALTLCAYLAQTITLVPAQEYKQTIYKEIYSSMIVSDDLIHNKSLFICELTNAEDLLNKIETLLPGEYMLIALDELFKSTHHKKGEKFACQLLENLYVCPQIITIVSTHFEELALFADLRKDIVTNYTLKNFILQPGIGCFDASLDTINQQFKTRLIL